ncbi:MAG: hypothetical protein ACRD2S_12495, partial [Terriglobales bacterium]
SDRNTGSHGESTVLTTQAERIDSSNTDRAAILLRSKMGTECPCHTVKTIVLGRYLKVNAGFTPNSLPFNSMFR